MNQNQIVKYIKDFELSEDQMKFIESSLVGLEQEASNWLVAEFVRVVLDSRTTKPNSINDAWSQVDFILPILRKKLDLIWHSCWSCAHTETENYCDKFGQAVGPEYFKVKNPCKDYRFDGILDD